MLQKKLLFSIRRGGSSVQNPATDGFRTILKPFVKAFANCGFRNKLNILIDYTQLAVRDSALVNIVLRQYLLNVTFVKWSEVICALEPIVSSTSAPIFMELLQKHLICLVYIPCEVNIAPLIHPKSKQIIITH